MRAGSLGQPYCVRALLLTQPLEVVAQPSPPSSTYQPILSIAFYSTLRIVLDEASLGYTALHCSRLFHLPHSF